MKCIYLILFTIVFSTTAFSQVKPFRFAFISDTHIGSPNGGAEEDLERTVADINSMKDIDFVLLTGDITELGTKEQLQSARQILDQLKAPWAVIAGNHDTGWSESGGLDFTTTFGYDKTHFTSHGIHFLGCASGPYVRMSDGHVPKDAVNWLKKELAKIKGKEPIIFFNHYPLDEGLDNWYEVIDILKTKNTILALCGHGHNNRVVKAEDIPSVMGRSNLRAKAREGGYNLVDVRPDSIIFTERKPLSKTEKQWTSVAVMEHHYNTVSNFPRPDFSMNLQYSNVQPAWTYNSSANVISTPAVMNNLVVFGNQLGAIEALNITSGRLVWKFETGAPIFSSPAVAGNKMVVGTAAGEIYCIDNKGKPAWKVTQDRAVLGAPLIENNLVYIGSSDHRFNAYELSTGKLKWSNTELQGPVVSKPVIADNKIIFGAWDTFLYCIDKTSGATIWKWSNGSKVINFSPAACIPVVKDKVVYVVAPDRYLSAIDIESGKTLWRTNEATVRESIGISENGELIYGKTMQDTIVAFHTTKDQPSLAWKMNAGYGYEHAPSMLIEKAGSVFFGTRNGVVYSINALTKEVRWKYKIDNSMVNTVNVLDGKKLIASTMDGKVCLLQEK